MGDTQIERLLGHAANLENENARLQALVTESEARRHRAIFESAIDFAIIALDRGGCVMDWNPGAEQILGWSAEEMRGVPAERFFTAEDRATGRANFEMQRALEAGRANDERWHAKKDGSQFWASGEMMPLRGDDGEHLGFLKILRDRTKNRQMAEAQRADAEFLRSVLASSGDCIKVLDLHARLVFMNDAGLRLLGISDFNDVRGCPWFDFWQDAGIADAHAAVATAKAGGVAHFQGKAIGASGPLRWWDVQVTPILDAVGQPEKLLVVSRDLTATRAAEASLREVQALNTLILHSSSDYTVVMDLDARTQFVSPGGIEAMEIVDVDATLGLSWLSVWTGTDHGKACAAVADARAGGVGRFQGFCPTQQGTLKWWDVVVSPLPGPNGKPLQLVSVGRDITGLKQAEKRLALSEERLTLALGASGAIGIWDWDLTTDLVHADANLARISCVDTDWASRGAPLAEYTKNVYPQDMPALRAALDNLFKTDVFSCEYRVAQVDGSLRWVMARGRLVRGEDGAPLRFPGATVDITERKLAEAGLQDMNTTLEQQVRERTHERDQIWQQSKDMLCVTNFEGYFLSLNPAWAATLGWTEREMRARPGFELVHPDDQTATRASSDALARGEPQLSFENRFRRRDGSYCWLSWNAVPRDNLVYATVRDITTSKEQAEMHQKLEEQLRQSQKMEAVGQLTGGLAHDFNNLLASITGSFELLQRRVAQGRYSDLDRYITVGQGATRRAAALTHRLLAFSRRQTLDPKATDVNRLITGIEDLVRRTVSPAVEMQVIKTANVWTTLVDPNQLENALLNLCINARDAMPDGGSLTIETANKLLEAGEASEHDLLAGQYVVLSVTDTGTGMPPEIMVRVFEPFFTTKPLGMGTGLGLSMVYGFARQSGGQVHIASEVGRGTTMCIYLPRHDVQEITTDAAAPVDIPRAAQGETVLVVDDEPTVRMLVIEVLQELGYSALEAGDGAAGLKVLQSSVRVDLLVTDVGLPGGMNGRQMADAGRVIRPELRVLFITGYAENAVVGNGQLAQGMQVLTKPFTMDALATRVKELIARG